MAVSSLHPCSSPPRGAVAAWSLRPSPLERVWQIHPGIEQYRLVKIVWTSNWTWPA